MKNKILWILAFLPTLITAVVINFMPDKVPMHYDIQGNIDRWGSKYESFVLPVMIIVIALFFSCFIRHYKKKQNSEVDDKEKAEAKNNEKVIYYVAVGMVVMFGILHCFYMYSAFVEAQNNMDSWVIDSSVVINVLMALFIIFIGNMLPKSRNNSVVGVRTVWSMHNGKTWAATNRFGGAALMVCGVLIIIESLIFGGVLSTMIMLGLIIVFSIVVIVYSYKVYKRYE